MKVEIQIQPRYGAVNDDLNETLIIREGPHRWEGTMGGRGEFSASQIRAWQSGGLWIDRTRGWIPATAGFRAFTRVRELLLYLPLPDGCMIDDEPFVHFDGTSLVGQFWHMYLGVPLDIKHAMQEIAIRLSVLGAVRILQDDGSVLTPAESRKRATRGYGEGGEVNA